MAKILLIGDICAERQYFVKNIPEINQVGLVAHANYLTSSKIINAGRILARDHEVALFGAVGEDENAKQAIKDLQKYKIDSNLVYATNKSTDQVLVFTNDLGQSSIILYQATKDDFDIKKLNSISDYNYIYTATSIPLPQLYEIVQKAARAGIEVFLDTPNQHEIIDLSKIKTVSFLVPNRLEAEFLTEMKISSIQDGLDAARKLKKYIDGHIVITMDKDGCIVFAKDWDKPQHFPTQSTEAIDTTGAGDIFRGVLLREYLQTSDIRKSVEKAVELSATSVKTQGVNNSILFINNL